MNAILAELPCGCRRGYSHCPRAKLLWHRVNLAWQTWQTNRIDANWQAFEDAQVAYREHYKQAEGATNGS